MSRIALDEAVHLLAQAGPAGEVFNRLLDALAGAAPRGGVFLTRQGELRGWSSYGYPAETARSQARFTTRLGVGRLGRLVAEPVPGIDRAPVGDPDFGQSPGGESLATAVVVKGRAIAALLIERDGDQRPWDPTALAVLAQTAALRLELTLAERKLQASRPVADPPAVEAEPPRPAADASAVVAVTEPATATAVAEAPGEPGPDLELGAARRFARLVATDIRLYNEEAVALGRRHRDLADRLRPALERGRNSFVERHGHLGEAGLDLLMEAYVNVLAAGDAELVPPSLFD